MLIWLSSWTIKFLLSLSWNVRFDINESIKLEGKGKDQEFCFLSLNVRLGIEPRVRKRFVGKEGPS